jgi:CRISPR-associated protein Csb2
VLRITIRFPLGVYHARSTSDEAEWPPSPLRLIGALLAAAHGRPGADPAADRVLLQRLCEAPAPLVVAPESVAVGEPAEAGEAVRMRGATRWAPRNYITGPLSPRNIGRDRAPVSKVGVAIGDRPVAVVWPGLELDDEEMERLAVLASDVTFLGTTRSPAILDVEAGTDDAPAEGPAVDTWTPAAGADCADFDTAVRVPDALTITAFDRRHDARRSSGARVQKAGMVPEIAIGTPVPYISPERQRSAVPPFDPRWWGDMIVLEIDREHSETMPKAPAAYLLARAVRVALLGAFGEAGTSSEAPAILRGRDADPHCAIVPLPSVWGEHADGLIRGVALLLPHEAREPDVYAQLQRVELGLRRCLGTESGMTPRYVSIPGAGRIRLKLPDARSARLLSLREALYRGPARTWVSITPIVHSRWRKGGVDALLRQVSADCTHVGLPAPAEIEILRGAGRRGGADRVVPTAATPESWRGLLQGPASHLRITFPQPVHGPVLIGRARHFGLGLCVPDTMSESDEGEAGT